MTKKNTTKMRRAFNMVELAFAIIIIAFALSKIFPAARKYMQGGKSDIAVSSFQALNAAIEGVRVNNAGAYPQAAVGTLVTANSALSIEMGGAANTNDLIGWKYGCPAGSGQTITVEIASQESPEVQASVIQKINGQMSPWVAVATGTNGVAVTKNNVTCQ